MFLSAVDPNPFSRETSASLNLPIGTFLTKHKVQDQACKTQLFDVPCYNHLQNSWA